MKLFWCKNKLFIQYKFINDFNLVYAIMVIIFLHLNNIFQNSGSICILNLISNLKFRFQRKCLIDQDYKKLNLKRVVRNTTNLFLSVKKMFYLLIFD